MRMRAGLCHSACREIGISSRWRELLQMHESCQLLLTVVLRRIALIAMLMRRISERRARVCVLSLCMRAELSCGASVDSKDNS